MLLSKFISSFILIAVASNGWCASLVDNGNGTVTDYDTGLVWQQLDDNVQRHWNAAISYCNSLPLAGKSDWRLPQIKELNSIVDYRVDFPAVDDARFPETNTSEYWSASSCAHESSLAWVVIFSDGRLGAGVKDFSSFVRCVR